MRRITAFYVRGENDPDTVWGKLFYDHEAKRFQLRLDPALDYRNAPLCLSVFADCGMFAPGEAWSLRWVRERLVPPERANIGEILKARGLEEYDEFGLLVSSGGRCMQDDLYLEEFEAQEEKIFE